MKKSRKEIDCFRQRTILKFSDDDAHRELSGMRTGFKLIESVGPPIGRGPGASARETASSDGHRKTLAVWLELYHRLRLKH